MASEMSLHHYGEPLICTYSGGKDSDVMLELFKRSGVPFEVVNSHTTADAPETVYYIRRRFHILEQQGIKCTIGKPTYKGGPISIWSLIVNKKYPPTRMQRYCCQILKETNGANRFVATGVRWAESVNRRSREEFEAVGKTKKDAVRVSSEIMLLSDNASTRRVTEQCRLKGKMIVNPIIDWTDTDIWDFIRSNGMGYNPLYDCGYLRVGCIGCPMAGKKRWKEFADYPQYKVLYIHAFERMLDAIRIAGIKTKWKSAEDVFMRWMEDKNVEGQMDMADWLGEEWE